jgi:hypothetical protein
MLRTQIKKSCGISCPTLQQNCSKNDYKVVVYHLFDASVYILLLPFPIVDDALYINVTELSKFGTCKNEDIPVNKHTKINAVSLLFMFDRDLRLLLL